MNHTLNAIGIEELHRSIIQGLRLLPRNVNIIVGATDNSLIAASILSLYLKRPMTDLVNFKQSRFISNCTFDDFGNNTESIAKADCILVVQESYFDIDDNSHLQREIRSKNSNASIFVASVFGPRNVSDDNQIVFRELNRRPDFSWNCMQNESLHNSCIDIDGVLCVDPVKDEDDDGPRYENFLRNANVLLKTSTELGWLVTCRLEKYRGLTEQWLHDNGIQYRELIMMNYDSLDDRLKSKSDHIYKAKVYNETGAVQFIESSERLARLISEEAGKPVTCLPSGKTVMASPRMRKRIFGRTLGNWKRNLSYLFNTIF